VEQAGLTVRVGQLSDPDWTIARITNPADKPPAGTLRAGFLGIDQVSSAMSRGDIAAFLALSSPTSPTRGPCPRSATEKQHGDLSWNLASCR
jgi:hypothetical protein